MQRNMHCFVSGESRTAAVGSVPLSHGATLFCDFDGPIADVSDRYYSTYRQALMDTQAGYAAQGLDLSVRVLTKAQFWRMKQTRVPDPMIADWSGLRGDAVTWFLGRVNDIVNQADLLEQDCLQVGAREALLRFQAHGIRLVIVTLRHGAQVMQFLYDHDLTTTVHQIYGATEVEAAYPNRIEHKIASLRGAIADRRRLGLDPVGAWMIGDTEADIRAGQAAHIPTIGLTCGIRSASSLASCKPTRLYGSLQAAADFLLTPTSAKIL